MYTFLGLHFSRWQWFLWPLRYFIRTTLKPEGLDASKFAELTAGKDVIFILPRMYVLDAIVLNIVLRKLKISKIRTEAIPNRFRRTSLLGIRSRSSLFASENRLDKFSRALAAILQSDKRMKTNGLALFPVNIFYSRGAERNERNFILKGLFPDDGNANALQKILLLLVHSGNIHVHFGKALDLAQEITPDGQSAKAIGLLPDEQPDRVQNESPHQTQSVWMNATEDKVTHLPEYGFARRIRRYMLIEFNRERTAALGPELYEFQTIANRILESKETQKLIDSSGESREKTIKKAVFYLEEIAAKYNYTTIRALEKLFDFVWTRIFKGVRVRNFEGVSEIAKSGQIVWMPCHRSHLDYMLLSYVLFKKGLVTPHIAGGLNLNFWPAGPIIRRAGTFFLRRSFSGNRLYAHIFSQYWNFLMHNSFPLEFFHEGGRSRIGKLLTPKYGLTSFCVTSILQRKAKNTFIIPVYFGYDKVMEDDSYALELSGAKKQKESIWQLIKSFRYFFSNYGHVDVSFGAPIHFGDFWKSFFEKPVRYGEGVASSALSPLSWDMDAIPEDVDARDPRVQTFVRGLARRVNQGINAAATASGSALLAAALLTLESAVPLNQLAKRVSLLNRLYNRTGQLLGWATATSLGDDTTAFLLDSADNTESKSIHSDVSVRSMPWKQTTPIEKIIEEVIQSGFNWSFIVPSPGAENDTSPTRLIVRNPQKEINLWWYRGTIFHVLAMSGLVAAICLDLRPEDLSIARIEARLSALRVVWEDELFWPDSTSSGAIVISALTAFEELGFCKIMNDTDVSLDPKPENREILRELSLIVKPEQEIYRLQLATAIVLMEQKGKFTREELIRRATQAHRTAFLRGEASTHANLSQVFGARTFDALYKSGIFIPQDKQTVSVAFTELVSISDFFAFQSWKHFVS